MVKNVFIERKFFKISQIFFMVITSLSLLMTAGCLIYGLSLQNASVNERLAQPTPTYAQLKNDKAAEKAESERRKAQQSAQSAQPAEKTPPVNPDAIPAEYLDVLNSIEKSLVSFSHRASQLSPPDKLRLRIYKEAELYSKYLSLASLLRQLDTETKALDADAERIKKLPQSDPEYISWSVFLGHFFGQVSQDIRTQQLRVKAEKAEAAAKQMMASWVLYAAAGAFGIFIFFTMFLVLLSMEKNTYILRQIQESMDKKFPQNTTSV